MGLHKACSLSNLYKCFVLDRREESNQTDPISVMSKDPVIFLICFYNSAEGSAAKNVLSLRVTMEIYHQ